VGGPISLARGQCPGLLERHDRLRALKTFRQLYCERRGIAPERFERVLLRRCLYLHALVLYWPLLLLGPGYFAADLDFVRGAGELKYRRELRNEIAEFRYHPAGRGFMHRVLRLRVSADRLRRIFDQHVTAVDSRNPVIGSKPPVA